MIDNDLGKFPVHMTFVGDVFTFSHAEVARVACRFRNNSDLLEALSQVKNAISVSELPDEDRMTLINLLDEERQIISFSMIARNSVIAV
ncbi:multidrug efflux pump subunit AcrB [Bradyrhizobium sp. USDA 4524]|uniref:hypothetical protein n=1 Tax=unclassified Bradyrhizobium TaxID=2631580 RepID=UPI00209CA4A4|nr:MULTISPECIES: hypothetical protein [unclassified Bradyrhizobium]MCP1846104.1 multidrug efflux pump subunit AcrB [Bradyrhizobium sp. USDA 4538]MCP1907262.1 multidrug efflux pump subunit AcrB [Bradyrhizobium sp. USDA 4537]MCP1985737.1 multidrug efflux pump subunit AcrB [Bradyrhizobium sp. USDA 4539]